MEGVVEMVVGPPLREGEGDVRQQDVSVVVSRRVLVGLSVVVVSLVMVWGAAGLPVGAGDAFDDVGDTHPFHDDIGWMAEAGITGGYDDGTFRPAAAVTRQSMSAFLHRLWVALGEADPPEVPDAGFSDVPAGHPFHDDIAWMAAMGITEGYADGTFGPAAVVTRQSMSAFLHRFFDAVPPPEWFVVDSPLDATDAVPGDGRCDVDGPPRMPGDCTLRAAVGEANASPGASTIEIEVGVDPTLSIAGADEDANATGDLDVVEDVLIVGHGSTVDGDGIDRVLDAAGCELTVRDLVVTGGLPAAGGSFAQGGGVRATGGVLTVEDATITGNGASVGAGGVYGNGATVSIVGTTIAGNTGTGVASFGEGASLSIEDSAVASNTSSGVSSVGSGASLRIVDSAVTGNGGRGVYSGSSVTIRGSLVAENGMRGVESVGSATIEDSTLSANVVDGSGGGVAHSGSIEIVGSTIADNSATGSSGYGGGIFLAGGGGSSLTLDRSTVEGNSARRGGAVATSSGSAIIRSSTLSGNSATDQGGAVDSGGSLTLQQSTVSGNSAVVTDGIRSSGTTTMKGSVVAQPGDGCNAAIVSAGFNADADGSCGLTDPTDRPFADLLLGPLADNGGPTATHLPAANSALVDAIPVGTAGLCDASSPTDQRGLPRPDGMACDIGAVEGTGPAVPGLALVVDSALDAVDASPGDGVCDVDGPPAAPGDCTLRAAITESNLAGTRDTITIAPGIDPVLTLPGATDDSNLTGDLDIRDSVTIEGQGAVVDAGDLDRVFQLHDGNNTVADLTVTGGTAPTGGGILVSSGRAAVLDAAVTANGATSAGGGIHVAGGTLTVQSSTIAANTTTGTGDGGGVSVASASSVTITDSTVSGNQSADRAGGLYGSSGSTTQITGSTFEANSATSGGGLYVTFTGKLTVANSTLTGNSATSSGGAFAGSGGPPPWGRATFTASTIVDNTALTGAGLSAHFFPVVLEGTVVAGPGDDCATSADLPTIGSGGYNTASDDSCRLDELAPTDRSFIAPLLGPLADNGGPTRTHLPASTSPLVDAIPAGTAGLCETGTSTDQRGLPRPAGGACDIGAVEGVGPAIDPLELVVDTAIDAVDVAPGDGVCATVGGVCTLRAAIDESNASTTTEVVIRVEAGIHPTLSIAGAGENGNATGDLDVWDSTTIEGGGAVVSGNDLDRVLHVRNGGLTLVDLTLADGTAPNGGGLRVDGGAVTLTNSTISGNVATTSGGGVHLAGGALTVASSAVSGNTAPGTADAGGIDQAGGILKITDSVIAGNVAGRQGGGLRSAGTLTLTDSVVEDNTSGDGGGGLLLLAEATITGSTITGNVAGPGAYGGGILHTQGDLTVRASTIADNTAGGGAGFFNDATATVVDSTISGNTAVAADGAHSGGGIHHSRGNLTVTGSTVVGNTTAVDGGGVFADAGTLTVLSSTIHGNSAADLGGGLWFGGNDADLRGVTVTDNTAPTGAAIFRDAGTITVSGSVIAGEATDCSGTVVSGGYNIGSDGSCGLMQSTDQVGVDPRLATLADNGGPTLTRIPFADSPLVDVIPAGTVGLCDGTLATDQRGLARPAGPACDVGAVEGDNGLPSPP